MGPIEWEVSPTLEIAATGTAGAENPLGLQGKRVAPKAATPGTHKFAASLFNSPRT